jgi:ribosomal protein S18 acetylase RimI-like enzyme
VTDFDERRVVSIVMGAYRDLAREKGIDWKLAPDEPATITIRPATTDEARAVATLHHEMIGAGFLASLGPSFLEILYRALIAGDRGIVLVADTGSGVGGFIAGTDDTGTFYRQFLRRHAPSAMMRMAPRLLRPSTWRRVWETFRYGSGGPDQVAAELLSMAVAPGIQRRGVARQLVDGLLDALSSGGADQVKVVVGLGNEAAIALYRACGFGNDHPREVHSGEQSLEMMWRS